MKTLTTSVSWFALTPNRPSQHGKRWLLPVFSLLLIVLRLSTASAQTVLSGIVTDADDGKALPGATVLLDGSLRGTVTDGKGHFVLNKVTAGTYRLKVSFVGYQLVSQEVKVPQDKPLEIRLSKSTFVADEVVVSATRASEKSAMAFTNVSAQEIQKQNLAQDIPVLLNFTPSLVSTSDAGAGVGYTGVRIRGTDATRINVTINGIPYNDPESQGTFWVNMPDFASSVSSIQIQRGVGTSTNGAGAFGATVNINTNEFRPDAYAELNNSFGSFNTWKHTVKAGTGLLGGKFTVDARLSKITSNGYVDRASSDLKSFYVSGGYFGKKSFIRFNAFSGIEKTYQAWEGVPESRVRNDREGMLAYIDRNGLNQTDANNLLNSGRTYNLYLYDNQVDNYQQDHYQLVSSHQLSDKWTLNINGFYVKGRGYYEQFKADQKFSNYGLPDVVIGTQTIKRTDLIRRKWLDNGFGGTTFSLDFNSFNKLTANIGGGWNRYDGDHYGEIIWAKYASTSNIRSRYYFNNGLKTDFNLYAKAFYQFSEKLNGFVDLQYRGVSYQIKGLDDNRIDISQSDDLNFFNPKLGLTYQLAENATLYGSYSVASKEPNRDDYTQAPAGKRPQAETLRDLELGFKLQGAAFKLDINGYWMNYKNQLILTGQLNDVGNPIRTNVPQSYRAGVEIELATQLSKAFRWNVNATLSQNKINNFSEYVPNYDTGVDKVNTYSKADIAFSPNVIIGSQLLYLPSKTVELALLTKYVGKQYLDNTSNNSRFIDAYLTNDFRAIYHLNPSWSKGITLSLLVNNVFNTLYSSNGYTYSYIYDNQLTTENFYYPQAGTNFLLGVGLKF
ncbi:MAG: TonB-dependent receptor [Spirosomataceae bacterium]